MDDTTTPDGTGPVTVNVTDGVAVIELDDGKANALGFDVLAGLESALDRAEADDVSAVVIVGREGKFSAGFDLKVMTSGPEGARDMLGRGALLGLRMYMFPKPVVLAVTGHALAMGAILLCCADVRVGADGPFKIGLNEVAIGMVLPEWALTIAVERLSRRHLQSAVALARVSDGRGAVDAGFLDEVVGEADVLETAVSAAAAMGALSRRAYAGTVRALRGDVLARMEAQIAADRAAGAVPGI